MNEILAQQQAITNGALGAEYTLNGAFIIIGALLGLIGIIAGWTFISTLNALKEEIKNIHIRIDTREEEHDELKENHNAMSRKIVALETAKGQSAEELANMIVNKMYAISPPSKRQFNK